MEPKSFPFPVLSPVSLDYRQDVKYSAGISKMGASNVTVKHEIAGDSIIAEFLQNSRAKFGCMVSLPATMYRRLFVCDDQSRTAVQEIDYQDSGAHDNIELPMFRPVIIKTGNTDISAPKREQGFNELWLGGKINFPDGGIIGFSDWNCFGVGLGSMLIVKSVDDEEGWEPGMIKVQGSGESGFRFLVNVHKDFHKAIRNQSEGNHVTSILIHALSRGFEILASDYKEKEEWQEHLNLKLLAQWLEKENLPHWTDDDFHPEEVATRLYPHNLPDLEDEEYD